MVIPYLFEGKVWVVWGCNFVGEIGTDVIF